ncbi:MAG: hypothetical protein AB1589_36460 [Cyanobacteriota bacterium]
MQWKKIWVKAVIWLVTEIILNLLGLDNLADYSEFLFEQEIAIAARNQHQIIAAAPFRRPRFYDLPYHFTLTLKA